MSGAFWRGFVDGLGLGPLWRRIFPRQLTPKQEALARRAMQIAHEQRCERLAALIKDRDAVKRDAFESAFSEGERTAVAWRAFDAGYRAARKHALTERQNSVVTYAKR